MADIMRQLLSLQATTLCDVDDTGHVLVTSDATGSAQLVEVDAEGNRRQLTDFGEPVTGRYLPGETRRVVISVDPAGSERTQLSVLDLDHPAAEPMPLAVDAEHIHMLLDVAPDTVFYATNRRNNVDFDIVAHTVSTGKERVLYDRGGSFEESAVSPGGTRIAASRLTLLPASSQLLLIDVATGEVDEITDPAVAGDWQRLRWTGEGRFLLASSDSDAERHSIRAFDVEERGWRIVLADADADLFAVPDPRGERWAVVRSRAGADELAIHSLTDGRLGEPVPVTLPDVGVVSFMTALRWSPDGSALGFTFASPRQPPEAFSCAPDGALRRRTVSNDPALLPALRPARLHTVPSFDGEQVPLFVLQCDHPDGSAVMYIHGGPEGASVLSWNGVTAALALAGHTVVLPNVRGSAGYGRRWMSLDDVDKRLDSVADIAAIREWLPTIGVDRTRVALFGGSYGGYMVLAGLTFHAGLWAGGVDIVGISSLVTFLENTSAYRRAYREREYGTLAEHRDVLEAASPLPIIDRLKVPLFIIHGRNDPRVPLSEAEQVAAAVRANGTECELLVYDDEGHGLAKRANRLDAYPRAAEFLDRLLSPAGSG